MLIPNQMVKVKWCPKNKKYYENLGYEYTKIGEEFDVKIEDLTKGSKALVKVKCDYCGKIINRRYLNYIHQYSPELGDACDDCKKLKTKESNIKNYGVINVFELDNVKNKIKETTQKKYGVEKYSQCEECKNKVKQTSLKKYGYTSYTKTEECKEKTKNTNLEKYGVEYHAQTEEHKEQYKKTCLEKYGKEFYTQTDEYKKKYKQTCLKKYGVEYHTQNPKIMKKIIDTQTKRYGGIGFGSKSISKKIQESIFKHYGVYSPMQSPEIKEKANKKLLENDNILTSKQQLLIYDMLKNIYVDNECELNYPLSNINMDCMININNIKIDVEYDGTYWHKNRKVQDRKRDEFVKSNGYKVLRIKGSHKIPTKEQLIKAIDYLVKDNHSYNEILLDI